MLLKFMVFWGVRARVLFRLFSAILRYSPLFAAILGPECLVDFLFKVFLIFGSVPVVVHTCSLAERLGIRGNTLLGQGAELLIWVKLRCLAKTCLYGYQLLRRFVVPTQSNGTHQKGIKSVRVLSRK